jgi:hypothetical protein
LIHAHTNRTSYSLCALLAFYLPSPEPVVTSKPTEGNFLFGAKTTKSLKDDDEDGDEESYVDDATNDMFETIFGEQDDGEEEDTIIKKKALWQWQPGQN